MVKITQNNVSEFLKELKTPKKQSSEEQGEVFVEAAFGGINWELQYSLKLRFCDCIWNTFTVTNRCLKLLFDRRKKTARTNSETGSTCLNLVFLLVLLSEETP